MIIPDYIKAMDAKDRLAQKKDEFVSDSSLVYMDGNSLGPLSKHTQKHVSKVLRQQWGEDLIQSWNKHAWIDLPNKVGEKIAPIIGAAPNQVICCDSVSVNLFKVLSSALQLVPKRSIILSMQGNFPTDLYIAQGMSNFLGKERCNLKTVSEENLLSELDDSIAVLMLTQVDFRSGKLLDMDLISKRAKQLGVIVIWDLSHSAGALVLELDKCEVDFAVGCGYKYFNGGPGAPAFIYVNSAIQHRVEQVLSGWMGHKAPFQFDPNYQAASGISKYLSGTPNILSLAALDAALDVFAGVDMHHIRAKSISLSELFLQLIDDADGLSILTCVSPRVASDRGSQLSFSHPDSFALCQAMIAAGVTVDFRAPDIIRFGFTPMYQSFADMWVAVQTLESIVSAEVHTDPIFQAKQKVT